LLPFAAILVISIHYYKVSREHSISLPANIEEDDISPEKKRAAKSRIDLIPDLLTHEVFLVSLGLLLVVLAVTVFNYRAPLESVANPQVTPLDTKAPWYFWWLQGMLKLGDKILMGLVIPGVLALLLIGLPYIDRNPYRSMYKRPVAVAIGVLAVLTLVVLSYMGLPQFGIESDAATRIIQDMAPEEGVGQLRQVPFDQLVAGSYEVDVTPSVDMCPTLSYGCPQFEEVFQFYGNYVDDMVARGRLAADNQAFIIIEDWQQNLKKITMRILWLNEEGTTSTYERHIFLHAERGSE